MMQRFVRQRVSTWRLQSSSVSMAGLVFSADYDLGSSLLCPAQLFVGKTYRVLVIQIFSNPQSQVLVRNGQSLFHPPSRRRYALKHPPANIIASRTNAKNKHTTPHHPSSDISECNSPMSSTQASYSVFSALERQKSRLRHLFARCALEICTIIDRNVYRKRRCLVIKIYEGGGDLVRHVFLLHFEAFFFTSECEWGAVCNGGKNFVHRKSSSLRGPANEI